MSKVELIILLVISFIISSLAILYNGKEAELTEKNLSTPPKQIRIGIIDTGYQYDFSGIPLKLCNDGHYDFLNRTETVGHTLEHGTRVANIIAENLQNVDYCAVILQVYGTKDINTDKVGQALLRAIDARVDVVNISLSGRDPLPLEKQALNLALNKGIKVFIASGNMSTNLDKDCTFFPACYRLRGMTVVGALNYETKLRANYSNYGGVVNEYYNGYSVYHNKLDNGTSYATPRALSNYVLKLYNQPIRMIK